MDATTIRKKIAILERLADPDRKSTPEHERAAAVRMLERFHKLLAEQSDAQNAPRTSSTGYYVLPERWYGTRYAETSNLSLTDIAKLIRAEIKIAMKLAKVDAGPGALAVMDPFTGIPAGLKIGVRTQYYSGGGSINVTVRGIPAEWGWTEEPDYRGYGDGRMREVATPALQALAKAVKGIMNSYNYDGSDSMVDYFDVRFYGHVTDDRGYTLA